ncbi:hypothetical protein COCON_G00148900 [Conger conger]|uniref:Uncharacterized protein n=1 Tax=Conger conger TaxID=82655 RepID=A0A9Q1HWG0_CONCO|nr:hypothetical protein COCON_G00148900 [Conger conger]
MSNNLKNLGGRLELGEAARVELPGPLVAGWLGSAVRRTASIRLRKVNRHGGRRLSTLVDAVRFANDRPQINGDRLHGQIVVPQGFHLAL